VLKGKKILFGITGSIASYKSIDIIRRLISEGATVNVVMTGSAGRFVPPYTFEVITGRHVFTDLFGDPFSHINLPNEADLFIIAPATANTISKFACGIADNLLCSIWLAYKGPAIIAPAMNSRMYLKPVVKKNIRELSAAGVIFTGPSSGSLACGEEGIGRMADADEIVEEVISVLSPKDLVKHKILVTAGPTVEPLDPVRFISNRSSGKTGFEIARAALRRGADVTLVSGPSCLKPPAGVNLIAVESAVDMEKAVLKHLRGKTALVMAAAVADFRPSKKDISKQMKSEVKEVKLRKSPDILRKAGIRKGRRFHIGFAAETGKNISNAKKKLQEKNLDLIVLNDVLEKGAGFFSDTNIVTLIDSSGKVKEYPKMMKIDVANIILDRLPPLKKRPGK